MYIHGLLEYYYAPYGEAFYYSVVPGNTVSYINMQYNATGALFAYPGFADLQTQYTHHIIHSKDNPAAGVVYTKTSAMPSGYVMQFGGSPFAGETAYFDVTVNGTSNNFTIVSE